MKDLISREALREDFYELEIHGTMAVKAVLPIIEERIDNLPAVDAVEEVHAKWKLNDDGSGTCENCRRTTVAAWDMDSALNYCPHCGARMDGE